MQSAAEIFDDKNSGLSTPDYRLALIKSPGVRREETQNNAERFTFHDGSSIEVHLNERYVVSDYFYWAAHIKGKGGVPRWQRLNATSLRLAKRAAHTLFLGEEEGSVLIGQTTKVTDIPTIIMKKYCAPRALWYNT